MPDDERADLDLSMTSKAAFTTEEMGSEVERIDVGVQISPSKKRVQTRRVFQLVTLMSIIILLL